MTNKNTHISRGVLALSVVIVLLLLLGVGTASAITWGNPDLENKYSNVGALVVYMPAYEDWVQGCSGILMAPDVFLTAGHCPWMLDYYKDWYITGWKISLSNADIFDENIWIEVKSYDWHPDAFLPGANISKVDVGVFVLEDPVEGINPASLPPIGFLDDLKSANLLKDMTFTMVGYGGMMTSWHPPVFIPGDGQRWVAESDYRGLMVDWLTLAGNPNQGNGGVGNGDSGGPVFWSSDGDEILVGLITWSNMGAGSSTIFTQRLDTPEVQTYLEQFASFP